MFGLSTETLVFIIIIILLTIYFWFSYHSSETDGKQKIAHHAPTILTTIGIFATFLAIALGLLNFDAQNIQQGVPALLNSLKTAFWASVFGIGGAVAIKFLSYFNPPSNHNSDVEKLISELKSLHHVEKMQGKDHQQELVDELKKLRKENNDHLTQLAQTQKEALGKLAEMGTKTLISALEQVVRDFNNKITEQFGDNFKQLNQAVGAMIVWQEQYKTFVDDSSQNLEKLLNTTNQTVEKFENLIENSQEFSQIAKNLETTIKHINQHHAENKAYLEKLANMLTDANNGLPSIENKLIQIVTNIQSAIEANSKLLNQATQETKVNVEQLNEGMQKALTEALQQITGNLSALSEKFANDYSPIAIHLQRIVQLAQNR